MRIRQAAEDRGGNPRIAGDATRQRPPRVCPAIEKTMNEVFDPQIEEEKGSRTFSAVDKAT